MYHDPTVYIHITQSKEPNDAPAGASNWFVMVNVPPYNDQLSEEDYLNMRKVVVEKINRILNVDIESLIEEETYWSPRGIEADTSSYRGSLYGNASNTAYAAFMRHANQSPEIAGLYFCGGSVHPGGGVPLCLLSAKIVSEELAKK
jgi:phytoene dehydrogenase-like protein